MTVINSCDNPVSIAAPTVVDQEYTITDAAGTYQIPAFTIDPAWCDVIYSFTVTDPSGQFAVSFDANMDQRIFTFNNIDNVALAGTDFIDYEVEVRADAGIVTFVDTSTTFNLRLKSPCVDHSFIQFNSQDLPINLMYILYDFDPIPTGYKFVHDAFTVTATPFDHSMCGEVHYNAFLEG